MLFGPVLHDPRKFGIERELTSLFAVSEGSVGLIIGFLRKEERPIKHLFQRSPEGRVLGAEFRPEVFRIFTDNMVKSQNGMQ
jgi:hypothetical protein